MKNYLFLILCFSLQLGAQEKLQPAKSILLDIPEPSDVCVSVTGKSLFIVSDNGGLYETDLNGKVLRSVLHDLVDTEGVYADEQFVYVVEERNRLIKKFSIADFELIQSIAVPYSGGRNKGFEGITKSKEGNWLLFTESDPIWMFVLNNEFQIINQQKWEIEGDVSAASFYNKSLWLLNDEKATLMRVDSKKRSILQEYSLPVLNPEGICFLNDGTLLILSDDEARLYYFNNFNSSTHARK